MTEEKLKTITLHIEDQCALASYMTPGPLSRLVGNDGFVFISRSEWESLPGDDVSYQDIILEVLPFARVEYESGFYRFTHKRHPIYKIDSLGDRYIHDIEYEILENKIDREATQVDQHENVFYTYTDKKGAIPAHTGWERPGVHLATEPEDFIETIVDNQIIRTETPAK